MSKGPVPAPEGVVIADDERSNGDSLSDNPPSDSEGDDGDAFDLNSVPQPTQTDPPRVPEGVSEGAPEGEQLPARPAWTRLRRQYPEASWSRDQDEANGNRRLRRLKTLNREIYALTCGSKQIPPKALRLSKKRKRLNYYKQHQT